MAMASVTEGLLAAGHSVKVLCMSTHKHPFSPELVPEKVLAATRMEAVEMDVRLKPFDALLNLFGNRSYNLSRFRNRLFAQRLKELLSKEEFDVVHLESLYCAPYLPELRTCSKAKVVLRAHNVEHIIWQRLAAQESNPVKAAYLRLLSTRLKREELQLAGSMDGILAISSEDAQVFKQLGIEVPIIVAPVGMDIASIRQQPMPEGPLHLYHLGSMDWQPNIEAVDHFLTSIWPLIQRSHPDVQVHLAGRHMPEAFLAKGASNLEIQGEVPSSHGFAHDFQVMVVPLLSGGGMRVKIVEAMALGKVVLSTSVGAEGIPCTDGVDILIADSPNAFVQKLEWLKQNPDRLNSIGNAARELALAHFDSKQVTSTMVEFYNSL